MTLPDSARTGIIETTSLHLDRSLSSQPDVYKFILAGSEEEWTVSLWPDERSPVVGDTVLLHQHPDYPTHCARLVYDVPGHVL